MNLTYRYGGICTILAILALVFMFAGCSSPSASSDPIYLSLSETGNYIFPSATQGYATQATRTVTVTNTGNRETGALNITLYAFGNPDSFTVSTTSLSSLAAGANTTFTIRPNTGLSVETYTTIVNVGGNNVIGAGFYVIFTVNPIDTNYSISLSETGTYTFPEVAQNYGTQSTRTIRVTNTGNQPTGVLTVALSGANASSFTLSATSLSSIAVYNSSDFTIRPNNGLSAGTYTATVTVSGNDNISAGFEVSFTVTDPGLPLQTVSQDRIEYYWVDEHGSLVTTSGGTSSVDPGTTLTITAQNTGYTVKQWHLNGVDTGQSGNTYSFMSSTEGQYTVGLFVEKDGNLYNTNIVITVIITRTVTIDMYDAYGDGWTANGRLLIYVQSGGVLTATHYATVSTIANQNTSGDSFFNTYTFTVNPGNTVQFYWTVDSGNTYQYENSFIAYYTDTPPSPAFFTGSKTRNSYGPTSWSGTGSLLHRVRTTTSSGTVSGTLQGTSNNTLLGSFTVL